MKKTAGFVSVAACIALLFACRAPAPVGPLTPPAPPVRLGSVLLQPETRTVIVTGFVNQVEGLVELLACGPGGKTHESIFVLMAEPADIQAALLLAGLKNGPPMPGGLGDSPPAGDAVLMEVEWEVEGVTNRLAAERFLRDVKSGKPPRHEAWIFNGSTFEDGRFMAAAEESFVATYWDPWAIINIKGAIGGDDERIVVNPETVPPAYSPVRLLIRPAHPTRP